MHRYAVNHLKQKNVMNKNEHQSKALSICETAFRRIHTTLSTIALRAKKVQEAELPAVLEAHVKALQEAESLARFAMNLAAKSALEEPPDVEDLLVAARSHHTDHPAQSNADDFEALVLNLSHPEHERSGILWRCISSLSHWFNRIRPSQR